MIIHKKIRKSVLKRASIDLTPVIDAVFLLLIFFMVTTVFIDVRGLTVDLPSPGDQSEEQQKKKDINVIISADGNYVVSGTGVSSESLAGAIKGAMDENNNRAVIIQADPETPQKYIVYAMDQAYSVGAEGMAFAIEQQEASGTAPAQ